MMPVMRILTLLPGLLCVAALLLAYAPTQANQDTRADTAALSALIDREVAALWQRDELTPAPQSGDAEFVRRVYLDVVGEPPTRAETLAFLADEAPDKRERLIDTLLADARFGEHLADLWMPILRERGNNELAELGVSAGEILAHWLADQFNRNVRFDRIARDIITAQGPISQNPASAYYGLMGFPARVADAAGQTSKHFTGVQIQCAECHDHSYDPFWTQERFIGVASFLTGFEVQADFTTQPVDPTVRSIPVPTPAQVDAYLRGRELPSEAFGRVDDLRTYSQPRFPGDSPVRTRDGQMWRRMLADWMMSPEHPTTARYLVNRHWSFLFGIGLHNPVDDFNGLTEPSHPALLEALAADFRRGYDVKRLYRAMLNSRVYQLSSAGGPEGAELWHFASAPVRQLTPEQFFGALFKLVDGETYVRSFAREQASAYHRLRQVAAIQEQQRRAGAQMQPARYNAETLNRYIARIDDMRPQWRIRRALAGQYAMLSQDDEMLMTEGFTLSINQALLVMNGDVTRRLSGSRLGSLVYAVLRDFEDEAKRVDAMFLSILARRPSETERAAAAALLKDRNENEGWEDLFYALISTTEFATNH